ncbi:DNA cross-link repair protein PSO2/SNM1 [Rhizina undulata]
MFRRQPNSSIGSSPPSVKRPKLSTPKAPNPPKQSSIASYVTATDKNSSPYFSSVGGTKKKNASILNFFKPVDSAVGGKGGRSRKTPEERDELFIRHGGYELEVSDLEDEDDESDSEGDIVGWARGRSIPGELPLGASKRLEESELTTFAVETNRIALTAATEIQKPEIPLSPPDAVMSSPTNDRPKTPVRRPPVLAFDPSSIKLDASKSVLYSKAGSTPSPFKKLKLQQEVSSSSESAEEVGFHDGEDEEITVGDIINNRSIAEFITVDRVKNKTVNRDLHGLGDKEEKMEESVIELSDDEVDRTSLEMTSKDGTNDKGKEKVCDDFAEMEEFEEELNFEMRDGLFDPASHAAEGGFEDFAAELSDIEIIMKPETSAESVQCPVCSVNLAGISDAKRNSHVNHCLDGDPIPLPSASSLKSTAVKSPFFSNSTSSAKPSAFTKLMAQNTERAQWSSAVNSEVASRGKRAEQRTCPFYKKLFSGAITVDAFRYGSVIGCKAYFLSHFHSDHYVGLTSKWNHGPIYCSRVTANLVRTKLGVHPQYVRELPWEAWVEIEGVDGVKVRGLDANHCPGSMLFLFERPKYKERVLHCGDFRADKKHLTHELLRPRPKGWKEGQPEQRLDIVYLDTTYLNPKYAFPAQDQVIDACADMCISLNKDTVDMNDGFEGKRMAEGVGKFLSRQGQRKSRGKLLVVVGTYSIGKERVCIGIARALKSKIYASKAKMEIFKCLENDTLNELLTEDPKEAQVHMTPLNGVSPEMLQEYLSRFKPHFSRVVGFHPSGWSYKPLNFRVTDSPAVADVLFSQSWKTPYSTRELVPQRGSTRESGLYAVPYSEHSSFRELAMFCCGLNIGQIIPTVNIGSAKSRDAMNSWFLKWESEKRRSGTFKVTEW